MAKAKSTTPVVRLSRVAGRPIQMWYKDAAGQKVRRSTGTHDPDEAEEERKRWEATLVLGLPETDSGKLAGPGMSWDDFREEYTNSHVSKMRRRSAAHTESRLDLSERIVKPRSLQDMVDRLDTLQNKLLAGAESRYDPPRARATATVRSHMRSVIAALNWAAMAPRCWVSSVPKIELVSIEEADDMKGRPIGGEEVDRLLAAVPKVVGDLAADSWRYLLRGVLASGLRLNELLNISWDISHTIQPIWRKGALPVLWFPAHLQKNKRKQEIPLCPWLERLLEETPRENRHGWIFNPMTLQYRVGRPPRSERLQADRVGKIITKIGKRAGIIVDEGNPRTGAGPKYASCHDLRRTFATKLYESDLPPELIRKLMRHADIRTTERFYLVTNTQKDAGRIRDILAGTSVAGQQVTECDLERDPAMS